VKGRRDPQLHCSVPAADEQRCDRFDPEIKAGFQVPLQRTHAGMRGSQVVLAREKQRHIHGHTVEDGPFDGTNNFGRAGDLDQQVGPRRALEQLRRGMDRGRRVVGQQRRDFQRYPAFGAQAGVDGRAQQFCGVRQVFQGQLEVQLLGRLASGIQPADAVVVTIVMDDRGLENRRVRRQPGDRKIGDVAGQRAAARQVAADAVEPQALPRRVQAMGDVVHVVRSE